MALNREELVKLAKLTAHAKPSSTVAYSFGDENFSYADLNETLRKELLELAPDYQTYKQNSPIIFRLIETAIDDILPEEVMSQYGAFAEFKTVRDGEQAVFTQRITEASRRRAKQFITKVSPAGVYEVFKLDGRSFRVETTAFGGAAYISFEEFLQGRVNFADVLDIVMERLDEIIYEEIAKALEGAVTGLQAANKHSGAFDESEMDKLIAVADSYGRSTIYCTYEFAALMVPEAGWVSDDMRNQKWNNGYLANYKGHNVIVLRQSYTDETNTKKVINPSFAWIIPTNNGEKPVKIVFEGETHVRERDMDDWSKEIQVYKKMGIGAMITNNICVYENTDLSED